MEPLGVVDAHNEGMETQNGALEGLYSVDQCSQIRITLMRSRIRIHLSEKLVPNTHFSEKAGSGSALK